MPKQIAIPVTYTTAANLTEGKGKMQKACDVICESER